MNIKSRIVVDEIAVKKFNEEQTNWTATCRKCKVELSGTLAEIRGHVCGKESK